MVSTVVIALSRVLETFRFGATETITVASGLPYGAVLGRDLGLTTIIVLFPVGLTVLARTPSVSFGDALRVGLPAIIFIGLPFVIGIGGQVLLLPDRWFPFGYLFAAITSAVPIVYLRHRLGAKRGKVGASLIVALFVIVMISNPLGNVTRPTYGQTGEGRSYFTGAEIQAPSFLSGLPTSARLIADGRYADLVLTTWYSTGNRILPLTPSLVRVSLESEPVLVALGPSLSYYKSLPQAFWNQLASSSAVSRVYDDGSVWMYIGD
jgi:hypothetical protein